MIVDFLSKLFRKSPPELGIIDSQFPQKHPFGFRNFEINGLLSLFPRATAFAMFRMYPEKDAWFHHGYGTGKKAFEENLKSYLKVYPENKGRVKRLPKRVKRPFLAYSYFLAETYTMLPFLEENALPFVFVLYPGGAFGLNNASSDKMLARIFNSPYFRKVIVTQPVTRCYLIESGLCPEERICFEYGAYLQFFKEEIPVKKRFGSDKDTLDICFVGAKYSDKGVDKGFDLFIDVAKILAEKYDNLRFHVIGGFDETETDVARIKDKITFYGYLSPEALKGIYSLTDICLSPNRPFKLFEGNFDGFPLCLDAMAFANVLMTTDELGNNIAFEDGRDLVIIRPDPEDILAKIEPLLDHPEQLYDLGARGQAKIYEIMDPRVRLEHIRDILMRETEQVNGYG